jgi:mono/diheme cytochrome c family protein
MRRLIARLLRVQWLALLAVALAGALAGAATGPAAEQSARPLPKAWRSNCAYCHDGHHFAPVLLGRALPSPMIRQWVRSGANGMPPFPDTAISAEELDLLAKWITNSPKPLERNKP